jgi:hypothetical protein
MKETTDLFPEISDFIKKGQIHRAFLAIDELPRAAAKRECLSKIYTKLKELQHQMELKKVDARWEPWIDGHLCSLFLRYKLLGDWQLATDVSSLISDQRRRRATELLEKKNRNLWLLYEG